MSGHPLLTDLYQLNMMQAYLDHDETGTAVFELTVRKLPARRGFLIAAGLEQALDFLESVRFSDEDIGWLARTGRFGKAVLDHLSKFRFSGDVHAMPEGTVFFGGEPILRITAPLPDAQLLETRLMNIMHFQSLVASKAARMMLAAQGRSLVDFGLRRAHGSEAGLMAARASYVAGFAGTATVQAEKLYGIPTFGTMAHSFIEAYDDEMRAFEDFAISRPNNLTFLIDTYDTEAGARKVVALAPKLKARGIVIRSVRLDSGDLDALSRSVRSILDDGGLSEVAIMASGGLDEDSIAALMRAGAPINGFGVGTSLTTSSDAPSLDCAYKLQEYDGLPRRKRATGKETWPGRKQVWRRYGPDGRMTGDLLAVDSEAQQGEPLIQLMMKDGRRVAPSPSLEEIRSRAAHDLARLPEPLRRLDAAGSYPVGVAESLQRLTREVDDRLARRA
jgi:nicotinate phosphoribosyltransferase